MKDATSTEIRSKFDKAAKEVQQLADDIISRAVEAVGDINEDDCFVDEGELLLPNQMLSKVTLSLSEIAEWLEKTSSNKRPKKSDDHDEVGPKPVKGAVVEEEEAVEAAD